VVYVAAAGPPIAADGTSSCEIFQPPNRGELIAPWTTGGGTDKSRSRQIVAKAVNQLTKNCSVRHTSGSSLLEVSNKSATVYNLSKKPAQPLQPEQTREIRQTLLTI
jgi:hypothetical protein